MGDLDKEEMRAHCVSALYFADLCVFSVITVISVRSNNFITTRKNTNEVTPFLFYHFLFAFIYLFIYLSIGSSANDPTLMKM